jgi:hypothetical protein
MANLKIISSKGGARFSVAAEHADKFQRLIDGLESAGYSIDPKQSGGYNYRNIAGTNKLSEHAFGNAIDVNWTRNARGKPGDIDPALAQKLAEEVGLEWGGTWQNRDDMHFEVPRGARAPVPVQNRGLTQYAGVAPAAQPSPVPASPQPAPRGGQDMDPTLMSFLTQLVGGGTPAAPQATASAAPAGGFGSMAPPSRGDEQNQLAANAANMELGGSALPQQGAPGGRMPVDLSRLRQVLASRARLGTGVV